MISPKAVPLPCSLLAWDLGQPLPHIRKPAQGTRCQEFGGLGVWRVQHGAHLETGMCWPGHDTTAGREGPSKAPRPGKGAEEATQGQANLTVDGGGLPMKVHL